MAQNSGGNGLAAADGGPAVTTLGHQSDVGRVRRHNEDSYALRDDLGLWIVADGMGAAAAGETAPVWTGWFGGVWWRQRSKQIL